MSALPQSGSRGRGSKKSPDSGAREKPGRDSSGTLLQRALPVFILAVLTLIYFWKLLTPLEASRCWLWEDFLYQNYPYRVFAAASLAAGHFPFWNPYVFAGQPFFADIQTAVLYPFNLLQFLFVRGESLSAYLVQFMELLHYFLAAIFTYRFLRLSEASPEGALLGALTFTFSGFMITHAIHMNFIYVFVWLPLILELFERSLTTGKFRFCLGCALVLALSVMGGYPQYSLYIYYTLAFYWLVYELSRSGAEDWKWSASLARLVLLAFICLSALGLNAFAYLPALELAGHTARSEMSYAASTEHSLNPLFLFKLVSPRFFGTQYAENNTYWAGGYSNFWETCLFVGTLPLILALSALSSLRRNRHILFAAGLGALCLWLALGKFGLLYKLFFDYAPGFDRFRIPGRFAALVSFALALLAGHGWDRMTSKSGETVKSFFRRPPVYIIAALVLVTLAAFIVLKSGKLDSLARGGQIWPEIKAASISSILASLVWLGASGGLLFLAAGRSRPGLSGPGLAACLLVFAELYWFGTPCLEGNISPASLYQYNQGIARFQQEGRKELFRINARSLEYPLVLPIRRNQGSLHRIFLLEGYNPLRLKRRLDDVELERQFDLLNVKYRIKIDPDKKSISFGLRKNYLPRAFLLHQWRVVDDDVKILETLNDPGFDIRREAVLETDPGIDSPGEGSHIESKAEITSYRQNEIEISAECESPGILVLSEWFYPDWKAWVDGRPVQVLRADYALRAVALSRGSHKVRFAYSSDSFDKGLKVSLLTALAVLAVTFIFYRKEKF